MNKATLQNMSNKELINTVFSNWIESPYNIVRVLAERLEEAEQTIEKGFASAVVQSELVQNVAQDARNFLEQYESLKAKL